MICRKYIKGYILPGIVELRNIEIQNNVIFKSQKINRIWGTEYMLMDSKTFMGGADGSEYENIIEIFVNIWNSNNYKTDPVF